MIDDEKKKPYYKADDTNSAIEILPMLVQKYGTYIDPDIVSAKIYQEIERVYFEYTKYEYIGGYLKNQSINRIDLGFIIEDIDEEDKVFKKEVSIEENVKKFLELGDISMTNCISDIFIEEWFLT